MGNFFQVFANPGIDGRGICAQKPRKPPSDDDLGLNPGKWFQYPAKATEAPLCPLGQPLELPMFKRKERDKPVGFAVIGAESFGSARSSR